MCGPGGKVTQIAQMTQIFGIYTVSEVAGHQNPRHVIRDGTALL